MLHMMRFVQVVKFDRIQKSLRLGLKHAIIFATSCMFRSEETQIRGGLRNFGYGGVKGFRLRESRERVNIIAKLKQRVIFF